MNGQGEASQKSQALLPKSKSNAIDTIRQAMLAELNEHYPVERNICLEHWGTACVICGMDFGVVYGHEFDGKIHVHHLKPMSSYSDERDIDPINDLRPVCPNCHMIIHCRKESPYTIDEVINLMSQRSL